MTNTTARLLPVGPGKVRNAIFNALSRHGVSESTAESIWLDLTTGQDPRPADVPEYMHFRGIRLTWPRGRHTRPLIKAEVDVFNAALRAAGERDTSNHLDLEDSAEVARGTYQFLLDRKAGKHTGRTYNPEPVRAEELRLLVAEATEARREANEPVLILEGSPEHANFPEPNLVTPAKRNDAPAETDACPFSRDECLAMQDTGEGACDEHEPPTREERIANMTSTVRMPEHERTPKVQIVTTLDQPVAPASEPDALASLLADIEALTKALS